VSIDEARWGRLARHVTDGFGDVSGSEVGWVRASVGQTFRVIDGAIAEELDADAGEMVLEDDFMGCGEEDGSADDAAGVGGDVGVDAGDVEDTGGGEGKGVCGRRLEDAVMVQIGNEHADLHRVSGAIGGLAGDGPDADLGMHEIGGWRSALVPW
jgi:hypothetical protein